MPARNTSGTAAREGRAFLGAWLVWVSLGETVGFIAPALAQLATASIPAANTPSLIAAGAVEGAVLGWSQAHVLRRRLPDLSRRAWVAGTSVAAALAWSLGLLPSAFAPVWTTWPAPVIVAAAIPVGLLLLGSIGCAQWFELRRRVARSGWWIPATMAAWFVGLTVFLGVATPLWRPGQSAAVILLIGVVAAALMAVSMSLVTGLALRRLLPAPTDAAEYSGERTPGR